MTLLGDNAIVVFKVTANSDIAERPAFPDPFSRATNKLRKFVKL